MVFPISIYSMAYPKYRAAGIITGTDWDNFVTTVLDYGGGTAVTDPGEDTDVHAFASGNVSITPIQLDLTNHTGITYLKENWRLEDGKKGD